VSDACDDHSGRKTASLELNLWFNEKNQSIDLATKDLNGFVSTVNAKPGSKRRHPNLFWKLARCLKEAGAPHPEIEGL